MKLALLKVPMFQGCDRKGVDLAPSVIEQNCIEKMIIDHEVDIIDIEPISSSTDKYADSSEIKYYSEILDMNTQLFKKVSVALSHNQFPLTIGGDHALAMGSVAGVSKHYGVDELSVIWFDAHTDINTTKTSESQNAHGMPVAANLGLMENAYDCIGDFTPKIKFENLFYFGARSIDPGEAKYIKQYNIHLQSTKSIKSNGLMDSLKSLVSQIKTPHVHLSFDLDVIDPEIFFATGVPEQNGLTIEEVIEAFEYLFSHLNIVAMDFVEYHPQLDKNQANLKDVERLLNKISSLLN